MQLTIFTALYDLTNFPVLDLNMLSSDVTFTMFTIWHPLAEMFGAPTFFLLTPKKEQKKCHLFGAKPPPSLAQNPGYVPGFHNSSPVRIYF